MPGSLAAAVVILALALAVWFVRSQIKQRAADARDAAFFNGWRRALGYGWKVVAYVGVLVLVSACYNPIGTKEEGVVTSFNKPVGQHGPGFAQSWTWPWQQVHQMDAAVQTDSYTDDKNCLQVRIGNLQTGCAHISIQWRIKPTAVDALYQDYRSFDHVRDALVTRKLAAAVNEQLAAYNPLDQIAETGSAVPRTTLVRLAAAILAQMRGEVSDRITVLSVLLPVITFDQATQDRINQLQQQVAQSLIAKQALTTNERQAAANAALQKGGSLTSSALVSKCLDFAAQVYKDGHALPAGFSCWPGNSTQPVIAIPGKSGR